MTTTSSTPITSTNGTHGASADAGGAAPLTAAEAAAVLGAGTSLLVGRYVVDLETGICRRSPEVDAIHGRTGDPFGTLADLRARTHPDDARVAPSTLDAARRGRVFAAAHRVVDARGRARTVLVVGDPRRGRSGAVGEIGGYAVDVTSVVHEAVEREADRAVTRAMASGAVVERAVGALMVLAGLDAAEAGRTLGKAAGDADVPVPDAARQVLAHLAGRVPLGEGPAAVREALGSVTAGARHENGARLARRITRRAR
ncbi:ANTAR domain-containing protein [Luteimicrobium sp. DT211]|uniref:ANTAR domain-containing protein n=1 Tax=Luteimicrobium sp. DT211 TaxID=3393412 RepID=UPI003CE734DF